MTTIIRYISVLTALIFFSLPVRADLYSYITRSEGKPTNIDYYYTISAWTPPLRGSAHPCKVAGLSGKCYANINHRHVNGDKGGIAGRNDETFNQRCRNMNLNTLSDGFEVYKYIYDNCFGGLPYSGTTNHVGTAIRNECVTLFLTSTPNGGNGDMYPGAICGVSPPPGGICSFDLDRPGAVLNHQKVPEDAINGHQASEYLTMKCSKDTVVRIYSVTDSSARLKLKNNLYTRLTLNDYLLDARSGGSAIYVREGYPNTALLKSTLETIGPVEPGSFYGNISIIMTID
ncbi:hypothetical protein [Morganella morganii]|uniref:MrpH family fimbial adhesin n=1 Tax=Morganella morganii TaxID=582 RepID=UPI00069BC22B|nr:hypothetical protein [Morganella morganii]KNZ83021.1 MrfJ [Morganella morganii]MDF2406246.1 MrfJ [Morganella morganii]HCR4032997.1 MrfJ [Morganella morganii]